MRASPLTDSSSLKVNYLNSVVTIRTERAAARPFAVFYRGPKHPAPFGRLVLPIGGRVVRRTTLADLH